MFGLLGPNGAGKTTTILMLLGLTEPTSGVARVAGFDPLRQPLEVKRRAGYMPDQLGFYDDLSGAANLRYIARLAGVPRSEADARIRAALERVRLAEAADKPVRTYSRGMRQRLAVAEILMKRVKVAILDEPTGGLDPQSTREFLELIRSLKHEGRHDPVVVASARSGAVDLRPRRSVQPRQDRADRARRRSLERSARRLARDSGRSPREGPRRGGRQALGRHRV